MFISFYLFIFIFCILPPVQGEKKINKKNCNSSSLEKELNLLFSCKNLQWRMFCLRGKPAVIRVCQRVDMAVFFEMFDSFTYTFSNSFMNLHSEHSGSTALTWQRTKRRLWDITQLWPAFIAICISVIASYQFLLHHHVSPAHPNWTTLDTVEVWLVEEWFAFTCVQVLWGSCASKYNQCKSNEGTSGWSRCRVRTPQRTASLRDFFCLLSQSQELTASYRKPSANCRLFRFIGKTFLRSPRLLL